MNDLLFSHGTAGLQLYQTLFSEGKRMEKKNQERLMETLTKLAYRKEESRRRVCIRRCMDIAGQDVAGSN